ncbi:MAG: N-6 DNA methylase [Bacteroidales bacterium]
MNICPRIEEEYIQKVSIEHRKKYAQFFTPQPIAKILADWLLGNHEIKTVLEPAFGLGIFTRELLSERDDLIIKGFEIDNIIYSEAKKYFSSDDNLNLILSDYMYNDWDNKYDGIICNPPYFKFHDYDNKNILADIEKHLRCKLSGFTNLYTLFLLKSIHQLNPNGRSAYIVPSEFMNSDYGKLVKKHLLATGTLRYIFVFDFEENIFDDALTTASIILCANDKKTDKVQITTIKSISEIDKIENIISSYPKIPANAVTRKLSEFKAESKWKLYYTPNNSSKYNNLVPFSNYAKVVRGIATGANDYFTFNLSKAKEYQIDEQYLQPCICHSRDIKYDIFDTKELENLKANDKSIFILNAVNVENENLTKYITKGEIDGIDKRYLTANRKPWYSMERRAIAPIWVSVFNRKGLRFIRNKANILNLTTFHCIYPQSNLLYDIPIDLLFAYLLTDTAKLIFEDNSREYGNGLKKYEPNDLNKGNILDLKLIPTKEQEEILNLYNQYSITNDKRYINKIETILNKLFLK